MTTIKSVAIAAGLTLGVITPAAAYPIDCAILLCLAGGFPPSAECSAAKATMIRRITPWPIEPPLQLWNCPMGVSADVAGMLATAGLSIPKTGPDGLTDDVRAIREGVEIYHIKQYQRRDGREETIHIDYTDVGVYKTNGQFEWVRSSFESGPAWLADAVGGVRQPVMTCIRENRDGCAQQAITSYTNSVSYGGQGSARGVAMRTKDHEGQYQIQWVPY